MSAVGWFLLGGGAGIAATCFGIFVVCKLAERAAFRDFWGP